MSRRCKICGKKLSKTMGSIGPECLNKLIGKSKKSLKSLKSIGSFEDWEIEELIKEVKELTDDKNPDGRTG